MSGHVSAHGDEESRLVTDAEHVVEELKHGALAGAGSDALDAGDSSSFSSSPATTPPTTTTLVRDAVWETFLFGAGTAGEHGADVAVEDGRVTIFKKDREHLGHLGECASAFFQEREEVEEEEVLRVLVHAQKERDEVASFGFDHGWNEVEGIFVPCAGECGVAFDRPEVGEIWRRGG